MLWISLVLLLICSGVVSASETALFGLKQHALQSMSRSDRALHRRAARLMQRPHHVLMTVLIANTTVNVAIFTIAFFALRELGGTHAWVAVSGSLLIPMIVIVVGEMVPKALALSRPELFASPAALLVGSILTLLAPILHVMDRWIIAPITRLLAPGVASGRPVSTDELKLLVEQSAGEGVINETENGMLQAIVALGDVSVREVMTPRVDIHAVSIDDDRTTILETMRATGRRRIPVRGRDLDDIRGVVYARDFHLSPSASPRSLLRRVHFVPEQANLVQLMRCFREGGTHLAIVVDEFGGTLGLVTAKDMVAWIVGDLPEEGSPQPERLTEQVDENTYRLSGSLSARVWAERFAVGDIEPHVDTVAGLILTKLGRLPKEGDQIRVGNLTLEVESMRNHRIQRVLLRHVDESIPVGGADSC